MAAAMNAQPVLTVHAADGTPVAAFRTAPPDHVHGTAMLFDGAGRPIIPSKQGYSVVPLKDFKANFSALTQRSFDAFTASDWQNIVVAGGAVLHCLTPSFHQEQRPNTDLDLFIHGLNEIEARAKIERLFALVAATPGCTGQKRALALRTPNTITFVLPSPKRHIQVVLRLHTSAEEVISCFDVDCCGVMWDGGTVRATARAARAIATHVNVAVAERRSWTYESRLIKYAKRGYAIAVPGLDLSLVPESAYKITSTSRYYDEAMEEYFEASGLRKLLIANVAGHAVFQERERTKFVFSHPSTMALANFLKEAGEHYGPSLPNVPGAGKYAIEKSVKPFFTRTTSPSAIVFKHGGIPTGVAEVGAHPNWWQGVHAPPDGLGAAGTSTLPPPNPGSAGTSSEGAGPSSSARAPLPGSSEDNAISLD